MKALQRELVMRYEIEFDEEETALLRSKGLLPPTGKPRVTMWLPMEDLLPAIAAIYGDMGEEDFRRMMSSIVDKWGP